MFNKSIIATLSMGYGDSNSLASDARSVVRLDATTDEYAIIMRCQKAMTVDQVALRVDTLVGAPTYQVSIQGVSATTGSPDGTIKGGGSPASVNWAPVATGLQWITLTNSYAVSAEEVICVVVEDGTSGTNPDGANYIELGAMSNQITHNTMPYPEYSTDTGATWIPITQVVPALGLRNSGTTTDVQGNPVELFHVVLPDNYATSSGYISACKFKIPTSLCKRVKVGGIYLKNSFFSGDVSVGVFDSAGADVVVGAQDKDIASSNSGDLNISFATPVWLTAGVQYYAGVKLTSAGLASIYIHDMVTADNTSAVKGYPDFGVVSSQWNASAWTDNVGQVPTEVTLLVTQWDKSSAGIQSIGTVEG